MTLEQRVRKLERENRWMRRTAAIAVAVVSVVILVGQGKEEPPRDLVVRSLTMKDAAGSARMKLHTTDDGTPSVSLYDKNEKLRASLGTETLEFREEGKLRAFVGVIGGTPSLSLYDKDSKIRAVLGAVSGKEKDGGFLTLFDKHARLRAALGMKVGGAPVFTLFDGNGNVIWQAPR
jgi:hypothetical protein